MMINYGIQYTQISLKNRLIKILFIVLLSVISNMFKALSATEEYPNDFNSSKVIFTEGLYVSPREGRYMVTSIDRGGVTNEYGQVETDLFYPAVGDQLVRANNHLISSLTLNEILSNNEGTFVLPLVSASSSEGHRVSRFVKIEIFDPHSLTFRPTEPTRMAHMKKILMEKRALDHLEKRSEEVKKQTRTQKTINQVQKRAMAENRRDDHNAMAENAQKLHEKRREEGLKREDRQKKDEKERVEKIKADTKSLLEIEKQKEELAKQKNLLEIKAMQMETERKREKQLEENEKTKDKAKEENYKHFEQVNEEKKKHEENTKYDEEKKRKLAQKIIDDEAIAAAKKAAAIAAENDAKEEAEKEEEAKKKAERERKYDIVDMTFRTRGPLGLFFVPEKVPMTLDRDHPPLKRGDEMVALNGMDLLEYETIDEIMAVLIEATWPKGFQFRRVRENMPGDDGKSQRKGSSSSDKSNADGSAGSDGVFSSTKLTIVYPPILFGMRYDFKVAKFGNRQVTDCNEREVVFSEPYAACKPLKTFGDQDRYREKVVFVQRGICTFSDKSVKAEKHGGALTVVVNNKNEIIEMPGPRKPLDLHKPTVMITKDTGMFFKQIADILDANSADGKNMNIKVRMADTTEGCPTLKGEGASFTYPWANKNLDGQLHVWNGQTIKSFDVAKGGFGKEWTKDPKRIVIAKPRSACDEKGFSVNVQNSIVIVERGECSFVDKARLIQKVGGIGMVCVNSGPRPRLLTMPAGPDGATDVTISTMMIPFDSFDEIQQLLDDANASGGKKKTLIARAQVKPTPKSGE